MRRMITVAGFIAVAGCTTRKPTGGNEALPPVTMMASDTANLQSAQFSPDWSHIYWWQSIGIARQLYMADTGFRTVTPLPPVTLLTAGVPMWSPDGSLIAVPTTDSGRGVSAIMVMSPDGSNARRLPVGSGFFIPIGWHPDNDHLDYLTTTAGSFRGFVTSVAHGGTAPLIPDEKRPNVGNMSPDGAHIAYVLSDSGRTTIWMADSNGRNAKALTTDGFEGTGALGQPWSSDGKFLAYESRRTGTSDIWVVGVDGGAPRQLTHDVRNDVNPIWSPDNKWIAFVSDRGKQSDIWVVADTGGPEYRITDDAMVEEPVGWRKGTLQFAYLTGQGTSAIWTRSLADGLERQLTPDSLQVGAAVVSPDSKQVFVRVDHGGGVSDIAVIPITGGAMRTLVRGGSNTEFALSPDGSRLAISSDRGGTPDLWVVDVSTGALTQLDNWPSIERGAAWSGDGASIYFLSTHDSRLADAWSVPASGGIPTRVTTIGSVNNVATHAGTHDLYGSLIEPGGRFVTVRIGADGKTTTIWDRSNSFPIDIVPAGDSVIITEIQQGGGLGYRLVAASGKGDGRVLLEPGAGFEAMAVDGSSIIYDVQNGATHDLGVYNRADGTFKRLTNTPIDESNGSITPDGKTAVFVRSRAVRRLAVVDLAKLLGGKPK